MKGLVIKNTGSWYQVKSDDGQFIECKIKGNFRLKGIRSTNPVAVGDRVQIILNQEGTAFINEIEDRKNYIIRRSSNLSKQSHILAANLDQCMLVVTVNYPETSTIFIDRFLASAEAYRVPVNLVFNKIDAYDEDEFRYLDALINLYTHIGYPCFKVSAKNGHGVEAIRKALEGKITLFSGHSGVGKSTLINAILPGIETKTGEISSYHNKGMHTTTFSEMFPVEGNGYIIDTPGIKGFGTFDMEEALDEYYFMLVGEVEKRYAKYNLPHLFNCRIVAYEDGRPAGCGAWKKIDEGTFEVKRIYIAPEFRRKGVASAVIAALEQDAAKHGFNKAILETARTTEDSAALYTKLGYRVIPYYGSPAGAENCLCFEKNLGD